MKVNNLLFISITALAFLSMQSCKSNSNSDNQESNQYSLVNHKTVELSAIEKANLNNFFTSFSEIYLPTFSQNNIPDSVLIQFGVYYNYRNNFKMFKQIPEDSKASINQVQVADTAFKFFSQKIKKHQAIEGVVYNNSNYVIYNADGEAYRFSQVLEMVDLGEGVYQATIEIYSASSGFTGDINGNPKTWITNESVGDVPKSEGKMKAKIRRVNEQGKTRYVLLEYLDL